MKRHPLEALLYEPQRPSRLAVTAICLGAATAAYCTLYNGLADRSAGLAAELLWPLANVLPWYLAFEAGKRAASRWTSAAALLLAAAVSVLVELLMSGIESPLSFALIRRLPALLLVAALLAGRRHLIAAAPALRNLAPETSLPLEPHEVDWVAAAGNYVELRGRCGTVLHRAPLIQVQSTLEPHGFVRVHRSFLVRRARIARIRRTDLILEDGTALPIGERYRSALG